MFSSSLWPSPWNPSNTWTYHKDQDCAVFADADSYFKAFIDAAEQARSHLFILGWDMHLATDLAPERLAPRTPQYWHLGAFLHRLLENCPSLQIYILGWDFSPVFLLEREKLQSLRMAWQSHPRMHFSLDAHHPLSASHHQKIVVVDDQLAFVGGLDLTIRRWDTHHHLAEHPLRRDPDGEFYPPFHDMQLGIVGPSAHDLAQLFRGRWLRATGTRVQLRAPAFLQRPRLLSEAAVAHFPAAPLALSRTFPQFRDYPEVDEIAHFYSEIMPLAKRWIYIENQYLTSQQIVATLAAIGQQDEGPEVIIVLPKKSGGWLEKKTMGLLQTAALQKLLASDKHKRLHIYFPFDRIIEKHNKYVTVHSKLLVIDDLYLCVGSANLNNRSMGLDTECNACIDAQGQPELQERVQRALGGFLSHFAEGAPTFFASSIAAGESLASIIERLALVSPDRHLAPLDVSPDVELAWIDTELLDMEKPTPIEHVMDRWGKMSEAINRRLGMSGRTMALVLTVLIALLLAAVWTYTPLPDYLHRQGLKNLFEGLGAGETRTLLYVPMFYGIACLLFFPINLLIIVTASLYPMQWAFAYIGLGVVANVSAGYLMGLLAGRFFFRQFFGRRTRDILNRIEEGHFLAIVLLRIVPIAPSSVINLAAGTGRIPFLKFLAATLFGMMPGTLMLVIFQKSIIDLFKSPTWGTLLVVIGLSSIAFFLYRWSRSRFSNYGS